MAPSGGTFPTLINPEAARLLQLVRVPQQDRNFKRRSPGNSQAANGRQGPTRLPRPGGFRPRFFPGLAEVLESHQPPEDPLKALQSLEDDSDDSELLELDHKVMSATAPPLPWRQLEGSCSDQQWYTRRQVAPRVPALPKWLRQQIDRAMLTTEGVRPSKSPKAVVSTPKAENSTEGSNFDQGPQGPQPEAKTFPGQRRGGEMLFVEDGDGEEGLHERKRIRWKLLVKLRGPKRKLEEPHDDLEDLEPDSSEEVEASMSAEDQRTQRTAEEKGLQSLPLGSVGRLENTETKRNRAFKEITLKSDKTARVQRLNHRRKQMYKGQDDEESSTESEVPRRSSKTSSVRRPPETADTAEGQLLLEAFRRYDREDEGELAMKDVRSCLADIGIHPSLPPEKRAMTEVLQSAQPQQNGLDFYVISQLVPKIWEAIALAKRQDLEYWFSRSLDEHGIYDMQQLRPCLEALGLRIHDEEWMEVERIFMPVCRDKKPQKKTFTKSVTKILFEQKMRKVKGPEKSPVHASDLTDFEVFQKSFFTVQEHLTRRRRRLERQLCEEHQLTHEQVDEFRSDLVSLDFLFRRFDRHRRKKLTENEVLNLLVACGADSRLLRSDFMLTWAGRMEKMEAPGWHLMAPGGSWRHAVSLGLDRSRIAETWRWVWSKDGSKVSGTAGTAQASQASHMPGPSAPAEPPEPRITPKSRADVRKMLQEERQKLQPPPSPAPDREQRAQRAQRAQPAEGRMSQGLEPLLRRIVGKSPDPRDRIASQSAGSGIMRRLTGKSPDPRTSRSAPPRTPDGGSILYRLVGKSPDPRKAKDAQFPGTPEPRLTRRICGKSPDPRKSPAPIAGTPITRRIVGKSPDPRDPRCRSRSPRRLGLNTQVGTAGTAGTATSRGATLREMTPVRSEARGFPGTAEKAPNRRRFSLASEAHSETPTWQKGSQRTRAMSPPPEPSQAGATPLDLRHAARGRITQELPLVPLSVANADAMRRAILEPRSPGRGRGRRPYRSFLALQAMATPNRDDDALASEILNEMRRERFRGRAPQESIWLH